MDSEEERINYVFLRSLIYIRISCLSKMVIYFGLFIDIGISYFEENVFYKNLFCFYQELIEYM